jgi:hypothetical protein
MRSCSNCRTFVVWLGVALLACGVANAQYATGFEPPTFTGSPEGTILTGQDEFYIPVAGSADQLVFTYADNVLGIPAHPTGGGTQFVGSESPGGGIYPRGQRDMTWGTGQWVASYDACAAYDGDPAATLQNIASFSVQPYVAPSTAEAYIHLFSWVAPGTADLSWQAGYIASDANGTEDPYPPGRLPGPEWTGLELYTWYRFTTVIDFDANLIIEASIMNLSTGAGATVDLSDAGYYLSGADGGTEPTGFRFFVGGAQAVGIPGNMMAWDNLDIGPLGVACPGDVDGDGDTDISDLAALLTAYGSVVGQPNYNPAADFDNDQDVDLADLAFLLADYGCVP